MKVGIYREEKEIQEILKEVKESYAFHPFHLNQTTPRIDEWWWEEEKQKIIKELVELSDTKIWHTGERHDWGLAWDWFVFYNPTRKIAVVGYL